MQQAPVPAFFDQPQKKLQQFNEDSCSCATAGGTSSNRVHRPKSSSGRSINSPIDRALLRQMTIGVDRLCCSFRRRVATAA